MSQVSDVVHVLPSLQVVPAGFGAYEQAPVDGTHVLTVHCVAPELQSTGCAPTQVPALLHVSDVVQALPSLQAVPAGFGA